jgi:hypothetical protein
MRVDETRDRDESAASSGGIAGFDGGRRRPSPSISIAAVEIMTAGSSTRWLRFLCCRACFPQSVDGADVASVCARKIRAPRCAVTFGSIPKNGMVNKGCGRRRVPR